MFSLISERKLGDRRRSDTVVVLTINYADEGSGDVTILTRSAPYEKSKFLGSGGSMVARLKLKEIDGRAPPGVNYAFAASSAPDSTTLWVGWWPLNKKTVASPLGG